MEALLLLPWMIWVIEAEGSRRVLEELDTKKATFSKLRKRSLCYFRSGGCLVHFRTHDVEENLTRMRGLYARKCGSCACPVEAIEIGVMTNEECEYDFFYVVTGDLGNEFWHPARSHCGHLESRK